MKKYIFNFISLLILFSLGVCAQINASGSKQLRFKYDIETVMDTTAIKDTLLKQEYYKSMLNGWANPNEEMFAKRFIKEYGGEIDLSGQTILIAKFKEPPANRSDAIILFGGDPYYQNFNDKEKDKAYAKFFNNFEGKVSKYNTMLEEEMEDSDVPYLIISADSMDNKDLVKYRYAILMDIVFNSSSDHVPPHLNSGPGATPTGYTKISVYYTYQHYLFDRKTEKCYPYLGKGFNSKLLGMQNAIQYFVDKVLNKL